MTIVNQKPKYWLTVRDNFWCFLEAENGPARMYEKMVYRSPVVKSIGLTGTIADANIYASGIVYDIIHQVQGTEIALGAVALEKELVDKANGAITKGSFVYEKSNNISKEFAYGYYAEESDGSLVYFWHPRCKLTKSDDTLDTSTDSPADPNRSYTIKSLPTSEGVWRVKYYAKKADLDAGTALSVEDFFGTVRYTENPQAASVTLPATVKVGTAVSATVSYADSASPTNPTVAYSWWLAESADGEFEQIENANTASYTPAAEDEGKYLECVVLVSGSAIGLVESDAKQVAAAGA